MYISPRDYARSGRAWIGELSLARFARFREEFESATPQVEIELQFTATRPRQVKMTGRVSVSGRLRCRQCMQYANTKIDAQIEATLAPDTDINQELMHEADVIEWEGEPITIVELVEDDLLLSVPWKACNSEKCVNEVIEGYQSDDAKAEGVTRPFAELRSLLEGGDSQT